VGWRRHPLCVRYAGYRFSVEIISHAVWLYFRLPARPSALEELLAARCIIVSHETLRQWARKFGQHSQFLNLTQLFTKFYLVILSDRFNYCRVERNICGEGR
jgi:hypothetical protein